MDDYISREGIISKFKELGFGTHSLIEQIFAEGVYAVIDTFPAADVEPVRHGQWVYNNGTNSWECSICGTDALPCGDLMQRKTDYCPHCGAKMDGGVYYDTDGNV